MLHEAASKYAVYGVLIAVSAVVIATLLVAWLSSGSVTIAEIAAAQRENIALWTMDAMPFIFALWGQYASYRMAEEATAMVSENARILNQALQEARDTNQAKTDFFARMSHELRTPLNAIVGMAELLSEPASPAEARWHAQIVKDSAANLLTLINDVLDIAKIEAGRLAFEEIEFDLRECVRSALLLLNEQAMRKGLTLTSVVSPDIPARALGDPGRFRQIIVNLVGNAIKYTNQGEIGFTLNLTAASDASRLALRIEVADTGIGIPANARRDLFKPYRQAGQAAVRRGGTGLGLAITHELVEAMEGTIGVHSEVGRGSTFWCTLQLRPCVHTPLPSLPSQASLENVRVLLADPNEQTRRVLGDQLRALGMRVDTASYAADAVAAARTAAQAQEPHEIILLDMFLPGMGGEELGMRLIDDADTGSASVVIITSAGARGDVERMAREGFAGYLTRPLAPADLKPLLTQILALRTLTQAERRRIGLVTRHSKPEPNTTGRDPRRVLLVEDSDAGRAIGLRQLSALGLTVDLAPNGAEALEAAGRTSYGAILLDLHLPDMSGAQVLQRLREREADGSRVPVVIMTAATTAAEQTRCRALGADAIVTKPASGDVLRSTLDPWLELQPAPQDAAGEAGFQAASPHRADPEMVRIFLRESDQRMIAIRGAGIEEEGRRVIARNAHTLCSTSRYFGDPHTVHTAGRVEALAPDATAFELQSAIEALYQAYGRLRRRLRSEIHALSAENVTDARDAPPSPAAARPEDGMN